MGKIKIILKALWNNSSGRFGLVIVGAFSIISLGAPLFSPFDPSAQNLSMSVRPPSFSHLLGTDLFGRDLLSRLIYGARVSMGIGISAAFIAVLFGTLVGLTTGFLKGWTDKILMRSVDILLGFPKLFIVLLAVGLGTPSIWLTVAVLGALSWMEVARIVRGEVILVREMNYVKAATALGLKSSAIIFRYILPNVISTIIVSTTLLIGTMILVEATLSFLGLGVQPPDASWGTIMNQGRADPLGAWWISTFAGLSIIITLIGFNLLGDGLRDILDPRRKTT
ncbi:MAG: ABC transporter permease [Candidatus Marinimicrobia bacterium]|nr:ABC transporter permease [Candidatus Neomarinimicrobiota bacterium]